MVATTRESGATVREERSVAELVAQLTEELRRLATAEARLALIELRRKAKRARMGAGMFGTAGVLGLIGALALAGCAALALAIVVPTWAAALVVGVAALLAAGVCALVGRGALHRAKPLTPEWTMTSVRQDLEAIKKGAQK